MEDIFTFKTILKTQILCCLKVYSYFHVRLRHLLIDFALRDFCTFKKLSPSVCIFNLTSTSGKISVIICLQVNNFFPFLGNLNYYHLPSKYLFPLLGSLFPLLGNLNCYLLPALYHFPLLGNSFPLLGKSGLLPSTRYISFSHFRETRFHFRGNLNYYRLPGKYNFPLPGKSQLLHSTR